MEPVTEPEPVESENERQIRYLAPNLITLTSLLFGITSIAASYHQNWDLAGWMIIYSVLCDRLDGLVARRLHATSELGMQLDSLADFLNFGLAPPFLLYAYLCARHDLTFDHGWERPYLLAACAIWVLAAGFRLARFNVQADDKTPTKVYFGVPTTLAGGTLAIWFLAFLKYSPGHDFGGPKVFGSWVTPHAVWTAMPAVIAILGLLMASTVRIPKVGKTSSRALTAIVLVLVLFGYVCGFARVLPEVMAWQPTIWLVSFLVAGLFSERLRSLEPPPLFPRRAP